MVLSIVQVVICNLSFHHNKKRNCVSTCGLLGTFIILLDGFYMFIMHQNKTLPQFP